MSRKNKNSQPKTQSAVIDIAPAQAEPVVDVPVEQKPVAPVESPKPEPEKAPVVQKAVIPFADSGDHKLIRYKNGDGVETGTVRLTKLGRNEFGKLKCLTGGPRRIAYNQYCYEFGQKANRAGISLLASGEVLITGETENRAKGTGSITWITRARHAANCAGKQPNDPTRIHVSQAEFDKLYAAFKELEALKAQATKA